ncbi:MAG: hypothetical protein Q7R39_05800 [Dehalococcoidia bacterium]|nr:hypothetical protein [Dehalococcoidia bacterium]
MARRRADTAVGPYAGRAVGLFLRPEGVHIALDVVVMMPSSSRSAPFGSG